MNKVKKAMITKRGEKGNKKERRERKEEERIEEKEKRGEREERGTEWGNYPLRVVAIFSSGVHL